MSKKKDNNDLHLYVVNQIGFHLAARTFVQLNVKTNIVMYSMDPVYMDALIKALSQLTVLVFLKLQITNLECVNVNKPVTFTI